MKKQTLVIIAVIMVLAIVCMVGMLVIPEMEDTGMLRTQANHIYTILYNVTPDLERPEYAADSVTLQQCLTALHGKCEDLAALSDFYYPADISFLRLADGIAQGAYSQGELEQMNADFSEILEQLANTAAGDPTSRELMPYDELSRLLTDFLKKWVRSA